MSKHPMQPMERANDGPHSHRNLMDTELLVKIGIFAEKEFHVNDGTAVEFYPSTFFPRVLLERIIPDRYVSDRVEIVRDVLEFKPYVVGGQKIYLAYSEEVYPVLGIMIKVEE